MLILSSFFQGKLGLLQFLYGEEPTLIPIDVNQQVQRQECKNLATS